MVREEISKSVRGPEIMMGWTVNLIRMHMSRKLKVKPSAVVEQWVLITCKSSGLVTNLEHGRMQLFVTFAQETPGVSMPLRVANPRVLYNSVQLVCSTMAFPHTRHDRAHACCLLLHSSVSCYSSTWNQGWLLTCSNPLALDPPVLGPEQSDHEHPASHPSFCKPGSFCHLTLWPPMSFRVTSFFQKTELCSVCEITFQSTSMDGHLGCFHDFVIVSLCAS